MSENNYHPVIDHVLPPLRVRTGGEIGGDMDTQCVCMSIKFWFFLLAVLHIVLLVVSISVQFYFIFETVLIVFSLLIIFLPDTFAVFVHFLIQLIFWVIISVCYFALFIRESANEANGGRIVLFLLFIASSLTFTILYIRLVVASR